MNRRRVKLSFPPEVINEPILFNLSQQFRVITNIHLADIRADMGWVVMEIEGSQADIESGLAWLTGLGIKVEASA